MADSYASVNKRGIPHLHTKGEHPAVAAELDRQVHAMGAVNANTAGAGPVFNPEHHDTPKLGSGKRFADLQGELAKRPGVTNPGALAASIGRKKYGGKKMAQLSAKGRKH